MKTSKIEGEEKERKERILQNKSLLKNRENNKNEHESKEEKRETVEHNLHLVMKYKKERERCSTD
jgi:hypothetical protein